MSVLPATSSSRKRAPKKAAAPAKCGWLSAPPSLAAAPSRKQQGNPEEQSSKPGGADIGAGCDANASSAASRRRSSVRRGSAGGGEGGERRGSQLHSRRVSRVLRVSHLQVRVYESYGWHEEEVYVGGFSWIRGLVSLKKMFHSTHQQLTQPRQQLFANGMACHKIATRWENLLIKLPL